MWSRFYLKSIILNYMYSVFMGIITDMVVVNYHHFVEREGEGMRGRGEEGTRGKERG